MSAVGIDPAAPREHVAAVMCAWLGEEFGVDPKLIATLIAILRPNDARISAQSAESASSPAPSVSPTDTTERDEG